MCEMYYLLIEYIRQLNFYFMSECDSDCELYVNIYTMYYDYTFEIETTTDNITKPYRFMYSMNGEIYNDNDDEITLDTVLTDIYQFAVNHTDNVNVKNDNNNNVPQIVFKRAKKYLSTLF